jgi:hypothetical protein
MMLAHASDVKRRWRSGRSDQLRPMSPWVGRSPAACLRATAGPARWAGRLRSKGDRSVRIFTAVHYDGNYQTIGINRGVSQVVFNDQDQLRVLERHWCSAER